MESYRTLMVSILIATLLIIPIASMFIGTSLHAYVPLPQPVICVHFKPDMSMAVAKKLIDYAAELGAKYVRFDVWWYEIEPQMNQFNETALQRYKEIINYMIQKGLHPLVIVGTGYPLWVGELIYEYEVCKASSPYSIPKGYHSIPKVRHVVPQNVLELLRDAMARALKYFNPMLEIKQIEYIKKICPTYYYASAKGYLTKDEVIKIAKECPNLPLRIDPIYLKEGRIPVPSLPLRYKALKSMIIEVSRH